MKSNYDYCIVGAGPSGLTAAYKLLKEGKNVVFDRTRQPGWRAR